MTNELTKNSDFSRERLELWKRVFCKGTTDDEFLLFVNVSKRTGLSPEARQIYAVKRYDKTAQREIMSIQISIDGFRVIAERHGKYAGQLGPYFSDDAKNWTEGWIKDTPPKIARVGVLRHDFKEPLWATAPYRSYVQTYRDGNPAAMWAKMPDTMLAKCAEALALRKAFPQDLSGLYTTDEMAQVDIVTIEPQEEGGVLLNSQDKDIIRYDPNNKAQQDHFHKQLERLGKHEDEFSELDEILKGKPFIGHEMKKALDQYDMKHVKEIEEEKLEIPF